MNVPADVVYVLPSSPGQAALAPAEPVEEGDAADDETRLEPTADAPVVLDEVAAVVDEATAVGVVVI